MLKSVALALLVVALSLISMLTFFIEKEENVDVDLLLHTSAGICHAPNI
jgi:hypothetical protein